ncbi:MAG: hypothetical protein AAFZ11_01010 [Pseudomonadota bacterium]
MMPAIEAQERLARIADLQLGSGLMDRDDARSRLLELQERAAGPQGRRAKAADASAVAAMGIGVRGPASSSGCEAQPEAEPVGETRNASSSEATSDVGQSDG